MVRNIRLGAWGKCQQDRPEAYPTRLFKQAVSLSRQARAIEATLDGINPAERRKEKRGKPSLC